jgi:hypothetical protein
MFMVASSVVSTILILNYHHRNADTHEMSPWVSSDTSKQPCLELYNTHKVKHFGVQGLSYELYRNLTVFSAVQVSVTLRPLPCAAHTYWGSHSKANNNKICRWIKVWESKLRMTLCVNKYVSKILSASKYVDNILFFQFPIEHSVVSDALTQSKMFSCNSYNSWWSCSENTNIVGGL